MFKYLENWAITHRWSLTTHQIHLTGLASPGQLETSSKYARERWISWPFQGGGRHQPPTIEIEEEHPESVRACACVCVRAQNAKCRREWALARERERERETKSVSRVVYSSQRMTAERHGSRIFFSKKKNKATNLSICGELIRRLKQKTVCSAFKRKKINEKRI